jgi:hypothetical protein
MRVFEHIPSETTGRFVKLLALTIGAYAVIRVSALQQWFFADAEAFTGLIHISGTLYSVLYAFATYVIWGQFVAVENEILNESGALKDLVVFSRPLKDAERDPIVRATKIYAKAVVESEWAVLSRKESTDNTDRLFLAIVANVNEIKPADDRERSIFERLLSIVNQASTHRNERLAISTKRMPRTLLQFVLLTGAMIFLLVFFYPYHNAWFGLASILVTSILLFSAHFVLTDLDNPFEGTWNVGPDPFSDLLTKFR